MARTRQALLAWYDRHRRDLPWRRTRDPYAIWLSEVMLQQTQVATVIPYWHRFLERFPTVNALAGATLDEVLSLWRGLGYYSRARNLHRAAQAVVQQHGGQFPRTAEALRELPGFGRYTAGAVASIAFGAEAPLVDGNVARVFARLFGVEGAPGDRAREKVLWGLAGELVRGERPGDLNQALMELGALVCKPDSPTCLLCPVREQCVALQTGRVDELPPPRERAARKALRLALAVVRNREALLLARREAGGLFGGLWELPSVELGGEDATATLRRKLKVRLGKDAVVGAHLGTLQRTLTHRDLTLDLYEVSGPTPNALVGYTDARWVSPSDASTLGMSTAMQQALALATPGAQRNGDRLVFRRTGTKK